MESSENRIQRADERDQRKETKQETEKEKWGHQERKRT